MSDRKPQHDRDKVIADTGWGIKPDDQPSNAGEVAGKAATTFRYDPAMPNVVREILLAQRRGYNLANRVVIEPGRVLILDLNGDAFTVEGLSYGDANLIELMHRLAATFDPQQLAAVPAGDQRRREYALTRAWAWGAERPA
jgi:hypothetical protein